ncbi:MAG: sigma-54 dependent transcriptional regulator [Rhodobacteraceae bacterium]|nr:sigma-54 dependent transcriptional regulator [Paracoccaceae bacterium]
MDGTILVADDDRTIRTVLTQALTRAGCRVHATSSLTTLMRWVGEGKGDAVISDVVMPDGNGLEMLPKIKQLRPDLPVIIISAQNSIMTAIQANEAEAFDYLPKPFDLPELMQRTARALEAGGASGLNRDMVTIKDQPEDLPLVGRSPVMQNLYRQVASLLNLDAPVLISGESGSGKTLIARIIHDFSDRRTLPFVTVSAGDLTDIEGPARVLARVRGGTLVIESMGDLGDEIQARLVRMMDNPGDHVPRFLSTSQGGPGHLGAALQSGRIRADLFYRVNSTTIHLPTLRERVDDIPLLAAHFLSRADAENVPTRFDPKAIELFRAYSWPGNVRQLENLVRRLDMAGQSGQIGATQVQDVLRDQPQIEVVPGFGGGDRLGASVERHLRRYFDLHGDMLPPPGLYPRILREIEVPLIELALEATGGNQAKCADLLGLNRNTLRKKITTLQIKVTRRRKLM